jgi:neutral trehalase
MLYHYDSQIYYPRPESYNEDYTIGKANTTIYHEITAGAESGWDFSTRWF